MSAVRSGSALRNLVLTPEQIPKFLIPSRSPLLCLSPRLHRNSPDRTRLLSDHDDDSPGTSLPVTLHSPTASRHFLLRLPSPGVKHPGHIAASESADTDLTTRAAMSLPHVEKVTTPYGFRAVLAASPCTRRRESLFHQKKNVTFTVTDCDQRDPPGPGPSRSPRDPPGPGPSRSPRDPPGPGPSRSPRDPPGPGPSRSPRDPPGPGPSRSPRDPPVPGPSRSPRDPPGPRRPQLVSMRPVKALGMQMMKELKKPAAALKALSPAARKTRPR